MSLHPRVTYSKGELLESEIASDPFRQFASWYEEACKSGNIEPHAMALSTVSPDGQPNCRIVLLRGLDADGFLFYTSYESRKGMELAANPRASLVFYWPELERQVRIQGVAAPVSREESERYFASRPPGHRLGAWASHQSSVLPDRAALAQSAAEAAARFPGDDIPLPPYWGGYRLRPAVMEFWQGRPNRLHDRIEYLRDEGGSWTFRRLAP